ncbi:hypothetical protein psyc5s11_13500 [Clostridium gelidum]|uniref:Uncharacterized protein n=1 Tax=Clostridium gelidum TaxID=704125 RepID=A0ABN6IUN1_9CLOT|nr:hypothetical protein [Clostridium gelidum]BCZ45283.1 hypothetical protein psyc5s11_13500 [Clostridium gelidum]
MEDFYLIIRLSILLTYVSGNTATNEGNSDTDAKTTQPVGWRENLGKSIFR